MKSTNHLCWVLTGVAISLVLVLGNRSGVSQPVAGPTLVSSPGVEIVKHRCLSCHESDLVIEQRLTRVRWAKELDKMVRWGTVLPAAEREPLLAYLVANYGDVAPRNVDAAVKLPPGPGVEKVAKHCLTCHDADIIMDQNLTRRQWSREIDKMVRWGTNFPPADREPMVNYLANQFGPEAGFLGEKSP